MRVARRRIARIGGAHFDPALEIGDDGGLQFRAGLRHREIVVGVAHRLKEQAGGGIAADEGGAGVAAVEEGLAVVEGEAGFAFPAGAMALVAILGEDGADFGFEKFEVGGGQRGAGGGEEYADDEEPSEGEPRGRETWGAGSHVCAAWPEGAWLGKRGMGVARSAKP